MNCYNHMDRIAVAHCGRCGRALCKECADQYQPCMQHSQENGHTF